jgi:hypothetical protein
MPPTQPKLTTEKTIKRQIDNALPFSEKQIRQILQAYNQKNANVIRRILKKPYLKDSSAFGAVRLIKRGFEIVDHPDNRQITLVSKFYGVKINPTNGYTINRNIILGRIKILPPKLDQLLGLFRGLAVYLQRKDVWIYNESFPNQDIGDWLALYDYCNHIFFPQWTTLCVQYRYKFFIRVKYSAETFEAQTGVGMSGVYRTTSYVSTKYYPIVNWANCLNDIDATLYDLWNALNNYWGFTDVKILEIEFNWK